MMTNAYATYRYAQDQAGQRLHIVKMLEGNLTSPALCGRRPIRPDHWRMTINMPLGQACKRCTRIARAPLTEG